MKSNRSNKVVPKDLELQWLLILLDYQTPDHPDYQSNLDRAIQLHAEIRKESDNNEI